MIQAVEPEFDYTIQGCRAHDMILDLICSFSREENFFTIFHNGEGKLPQNNNKVRRLAFQRSTAEHNTPQSDHMDLAHVTSYVTCVSRIDQPVPLLSFKVLHVLAIERCQFKNDCILDNLGNLIHLRYLSVRHTNVRKLPEHIGDLKYLQTLVHDIQVLPASIARLAKLVCLSCCPYEIL
jgi:disease resistance protein RPM1